MTVIGILILCFAQPVTAPRPGLAPRPSLEPEQQAQLDFILEGLRHNREKLRSGIYRVSGRKVDGIVGDPEFPRYEGDVESFCAFDDDQALFRFERTEPQLFEQPGTETREVRVTLKYIRTPDYSVHLTEGWSESVGDLVVHPPDHAPTTYLNSFDVRMLGIGGWTAMNEGASFDEALHAITNWPDKYWEFDEVKGLYRLVIRFRDDPKHKIEAVYWFDEQQGYGPVQYELRTFNWKADKWNIIEQMDVSWELNSDVWIPKTFTAISGFPAPNMRRREYQYIFEWESVNTPLDQALFAKDAFDRAVAPGTPKFDRRLGESVLVEHVNVPERIRKIPVPIENPDPLSSRRFWFLVVNGVVLGAIAIGVLFWWLRLR